MDSEIDKFLKDYGDKNINISYNKNKFNTEEITKSLKKLHNKLINFSEFNVVNLNIINLKKSQVVFLQTKKKMRRYVKGLKDIVDLYNLKSGSDARKKAKD